MKKKLKFIAFLLAVLFTFFSCANDGENSSLPQASDTIQAGYIRINFKGNADCLWIWNDFAGSELEKLGSWPIGIKFTHSNGGFVCVDLKLADNPKSLGMIPIKGDTGLTGDIIFNFPSRYNEIFIQANDTQAYISSDMTTIAKGIYAASFTDGTTITLKGKETLSSENVKLTDKNGDVEIDSFDNENLKIKLKQSIQNSYAENLPYTLTVGSDTISVSLDSSLVESWFGSKAAAEMKNSSEKLGVTVNGTNASFKMWAPLASNVELLLFADSENLDTPAQTIPMDLGANGFWSKKDVEFGSNKYYKYAITSGDYTKHVSDIWSFAASADSVASQIADISTEGVPADWEVSYTNPWKGSTYNEAVIYEMHIRDWSRAVVTDSTGKFLDIANSDKIIDHLKDLGITHVQILPMFDYAQKNDDPNYNWGYNPYHYNVPEGRYVQDMKDGTDAVCQMRTMIKALHDAGIAVNMDVVYNHTNGTGDGSLYDMTVPEYFYRLDDSGYINGSGCGNETATNHAMVKYYVIESLKHWMNDYHINGFRFDLMGIHEKSTMKEIYEELSKIDPNVMVYGEPWTGGTSGVKDGATQAVSAGSYGVGAFDDDFRDAIKGAEFGGFKKGQIQGVNSDKGIVAGLSGKSGSNHRNDTDLSGLALHYIECHDNYTLFDKLVYSTLDSKLLTGDFAPKFEEAYNAVMNSPELIENIKKQVKLGGAYVLLSQGTPFLNGGQEFMRTKKGNPDSYSADTKGGIKWTNESGKYNIDDVNTIDFSMKESYKDVFNTYKALIQIRKDINAFTKGNYVEAITYKSTDGVVKYKTYDSENTEYVVYFNGTDSDIECTDSGKIFSIDETNGTYKIADESATVGTLLAKSFVILKK